MTARCPNCDCQDRALEPNEESLPPESKCRDRGCECHRVPKRILRGG